MANEEKKVNRLTTRLKTLKDKLSFESAKQPTDVKRMRTNIIIRTIIVDFLFSIFAFSLKGAQIAVQNGLAMLGILLLAIYFSERIVESAYSTYADLQEDNFRQVYSSSITEIVMELTSLTRGKVYKTNDVGIETVMAHPELLKKSRDYIDGVWNFLWGLPMAISRILTLVVMICITFKMELSTSSMKETSFIMTLLILCGIIYFIFGKKRIEVMKHFRRQRKENESREEVLFSEIKAIEFSSTSDFRYHAERFRKHLVNSKKLLKEERLKMNAVFVKRSLVASGFMFVILGYKVLLGGEINEELFLDIVAISTVYSTILNKISEILSSVENTWNYLIDVDKLYPDFKNIYDVYVKELEKQQEREKGAGLSYSETCKIQVGEFTFAYDSCNTWYLINPNPFDLLLGEVVLVEGETGCGKTTSLNVLNGNVRMPESPIRFSNGQIGYLNTLTYHTDRSMADNYILNEIILSDDYSELDTEKLFEIIEGLGLKELFLAFAKNDEALKDLRTDEELLLGFMKTRTYKQFSSGQQQRIALAKLLYTLDNSVQAIWLDEAFNRLNDEIADRCASFILGFVQHDRKRLVLIATHQLNVIRKYCSKEISFKVGSDGTSTLKLRQV